MSERPNELVWETRFSLITNPNVLKAWLKAMAATYVLCMVILVPVFAGTGQWEAIPVMAVIFLAVCGGITLAGMLIMLLILGNTSRARFTISLEGVEYRALDKRIMVMSRIAVAAGGFFGSPQAAGAGLLSVSNEVVRLPWSAVSMAVYDKKHLTICLRNAYRDLLQLYCTPENFARVQEMVRRVLDEKESTPGETGHPGAGKRQLKRALGATFLTIAACLPLYALTDILDLNLMAPLLISAFSLATIWMIPLFGWVVLLAEVYCLGWMVFKFVRPRELKLVSTYHFRGYELLDAGEWIIVSLAVLGMAYLAWISIRALKGRYLPLLMREQIS